MPFAIVQTIENGSLLLSTVPCTWIKEGTLYWPKSKMTLLKLRTVENSVPSIDWDKFPCFIKRSGIVSYVEAIDIEKNMSDISCSSASDSDHPQIPRQLNRKKMTSAKINKELGQLLNVDDMFEPSEPIEYSMENTREPIEYIIENTRKPTVSPVQEKSENLFLSPSSVIESPLLPEDSGEVAGNAIYCDAGNLNEILNFDFNICKYVNSKLLI